MNSRPPGIIAFNKQNLDGTIEQVHAFNIEFFDDLLKLVSVIENQVAQSTPIDVFLKNSGYVKSVAEHKGLSFLPKIPFTDIVDVPNYIEISKLGVTSPITLSASPEGTITIGHSSEFQHLQPIQNYNSDNQYMLRYSRTSDQNNNQPGQWAVFETGSLVSSTFTKNNILSLEANSSGGELFRIRLNTSTEIVDVTTTVPTTKAVYDFGELLQNQINAISTRMWNLYTDDPSLSIERDGSYVTINHNDVFHVPAMTSGSLTSFNVLRWSNQNTAPIWTEYRYGFIMDSGPFTQVHSNLGDTRRLLSCGITDSAGATVEISLHVRSTITNDANTVPTTQAVFNALALKADLTDLESLTQYVLKTGDTMTGDLNVLWEGDWGLFYSSTLGAGSLMMSMAYGPTVRLSSPIGGLEISSFNDEDHIARYNINGLSLKSYDDAAVVAGSWVHMNLTNYLTITRRLLRGSSSIDTSQNNLWTADQITNLTSCKLELGGSRLDEPQHGKMILDTTDDGRILINVNTDPISGEPVHRAGSWEISIIKSGDYENIRHPNYSYQAMCNNVNTLVFKRYGRVDLTGGSGESVKDPRNSHMGMMLRLDKLPGWEPFDDEGGIVGPEPSPIPVYWNSTGSGYLTVIYDYRELSQGDPAMTGGTLTVIASPDAGVTVESEGWFIEGASNVSGDGNLIRYITIDHEATVVNIDVNFSDAIISQNPQVFFGVGENNGGTVVGYADNVAFDSGDPFPIGTHIRIVATPSPGYFISRWVVDGPSSTPSGNELNFVVGPWASDITVIFQEIGSGDTELPAWLDAIAYVDGNGDIVRKGTHNPKIIYGQVTNGVVQIFNIPITWQLPFLSNNLTGPPTASNPSPSNSSPRWLRIDQYGNLVVVGGWYNGQNELYPDQSMYWIAARLPISVRTNPDSAQYPSVIDANTRLYANATLQDPVVLNSKDGVMAGLINIAAFSPITGSTDPGPNNGLSVWGQKCGEISNSVITWIPITTGDLAGAFSSTVYTPMSSDPLGGPGALPGDP